MQAIILAAGSGKRLKPYSVSNPKSMIKIEGKTFLERQIKTLKAYGISDPLIITGYKSKKITNFYNNTLLNKKYKNTNMLYSLMLAKNEILSGHDIIVSYGDIIYNIELLNKLFEEKDEDITLLSDKNWRYYWNLRTKEPLKDLETFSYNKDKILIEIGRKPKNYQEIQGQYIGLFKISNSYAKQFCMFADLIKYKNIKFRGRFFDNLYMTDFLQYLINNSCQIKITETHNSWLELDTIADLKLYEKMIKNDTLKKELKIKF